MRLQVGTLPSLVRETQYAVRERQGLYSTSLQMNLAGMFGTSVARRDPGAPLLTPTERWAAYRQVPDIRACIDSVVRVISTYDWAVKPVAGLEPSSRLYDRAMQVCADATRFLKAPTSDGKSWQTTQSMLVRDLLVHDVYAAELPTTRRGALEEIAPLAGSTITPMIDRRGRTAGYAQRAPGIAGDVEFSPDQLLYFNLFPSTEYPGGTPLIETLLLEISTALHSARHLLRAYSADEVGGGLLVLSGLAKGPAERLTADLKNRKDNELRHIYGDNPNLDAKWVEFKRSPKDLDMAVLIKEVRRTIWRNFGCKPVTMGETEATPRATAEVQLEAEDSGLIRPILEMLQGQINARVMPLLVGDPAISALVEFAFPFERDLSPEDRKRDADADAVDFDRGVLTVNERRARRGLAAVDGGDVRLLRAGAGYVRLDGVDAGVEPEPVVAEDPEEADTEAAPGEVEASRRLMQRAPAKYDHIDFTPPKAVQAECQRGVDWVEAGEGGDGLKPETVRWARRLAAGEDITPEKARKMKAWLARHEVDKEAEGFRPGEDGYPSPGRVAWACWGGDPAVGWSAKLVRQMDAADKEQKALPAVTAGRWTPARNIETMALRAPCECGSEHHARASDLLPSDWQPGGRFRGYRTINLAALGEAVIDYRGAVWPLYRRARIDAQAAFRSYVTGSEPLEPMTSARLLQEVRNVLDRLLESWSAATVPLYRRAARVGRDAATSFSQTPVVSNWSSRADAYHARAMGYLSGDDGLIQSLSKELGTIVQAMTRGTQVHAQLMSRLAGRNTSIDRVAILAAVAKAFTRNEHRIDNWSGKLVELGNSILSDGMTEGGAPQDPEQPAEPDRQWYVEWVSVGDEATCPTCATQSARGFVPQSSLPTVPGGATECMARDRCVLVWWKKSEVDSGVAVRLSG